MIAAIVQKPLLALLAVTLIFNMTQRRHLDHGEAKRFASLGIAGILLLLLIGTVVVTRLGRSDWFLLPTAALALLLALRFRDRLFLFRRSCSECRAALPLKQILYFDETTCEGCKTPASVDEVDWEAWEPAEDAVLCFIRLEGKLLLIHKKNGLGAGKISAPGGRIEPGETAVEAAIRETQEEVGLTPTGLEKCGDLSFIFTDGFSLHGSVFIAGGYEGEPVETDEAAPFWCSESAIPFERMWADDELWLPLVLKGERIVGRFIFDGDDMVSESVTRGASWTN